MLCGLCLGETSISPRTSDVSPANASSTRLQAQDRNLATFPFDLTRPEGVGGYCKNVAQGKVWADSLKAVCEFALSLRWKLPNVIAEEIRHGYQESTHGGEELKNSLTANVRYANGQEEYSDIRVNGKPVSSALPQSSGIWSSGDYGAALRGIFVPGSATQFKFVREKALRSTPALVFEYRVERKNNRLWHLDSGKETTFPGYRGRLWIRKSNYQLLRLEQQMDDVEAGFPIQQASIIIDYSDIALADGTSFVLPVDAVDLICPTSAANRCWHDRLTFKHWQKFAARARVLSADEMPSPAPGEAGVPNATSQASVTSPPEIDTSGLPMDSNRIATIIAAIQETAEIEAGRQTIASRDASPEPGTTKYQAAAPSPSTSAPANARGGQSPEFKSSVRLVLVPTVVRDAHGNTVDSLHKSNFRLFDDRHPELISQFSVEHAGDAAKTPPAGTEDHTVGPQMRFVAYVFDDVDATFGQLAQAREAAERYLAEFEPEDRAAILTISGTVVLDFTNDSARLSQALQRLQAHPLAESFPCPDISYGQAYLIENGDEFALLKATQAAMKCAHALGGDAAAKTSAAALAKSTAAQLMLSGRLTSQASFRMLRVALRGISNAPGEREIVLVSPGFPIAEMQESETNIIDDALHAGVIINVLDPSGLSTQSSVEYRIFSPSDVLADLSSGTGGIFFRNNNDIYEGFRQTTPPDSFYVLGFSAPKADGKFHKLKVTLQSSEKLSVQARQGYYAAKPQE
jgi:VWFA-related protein